MSTVDLLNEETGEVTTVDPAEVARELADATAARDAIDREIDDLRAQRNQVQDRIDTAEATLLAAGKPGQAWMVPGGHVAVVHGKRRNSTVNRDGCDEHAEVLEAHGLLEIQHLPPPPPKVVYPKVSALRAAEAELAVAGVAVSDLVHEGGPGDPIVVLEADKKAPPA